MPAAGVAYRGVVSGGVRRGVRACGVGGAGVGAYGRKLLCHVLLHPSNDFVNVFVKLIRGVVLQLLHVGVGVALACFLQHDLHDFRLYVFLNLLKGVTPRATAGRQCAWVTCWCY